VDTEAYGDTEPPITLMRQIADEKGLSFVGVEFQQIRAAAKEKMRASRMAR
jgi:hypothetical protein